MRSILPIRAVFSIFKRGFISRQLQYSEYGDPIKVMKLQDVELGDNLRPNEVRIHFLACPINPADINMIQGVYGIKVSSFPAVGGNEGVARVQKCGSEVRGLKVGDWVQPKSATLGTWRTAAVCGSDDVRKLDNSLPLVDAATMNVNPPTAYRMLTDYVSLSPGDTVIQNGANSSVGRALIQLAKVRGYVTVNLVRSRPDLDELKNELRSLGADHIMTEDELKGDAGKSLWKSGVKPPKLAINCVSGRSTLYLAATMADGGVLVTYGAMSMQPVQLPASAFIFKRIEAKGFWLSRWKDDPKNDAEAEKMVQELCRLVKEGKLKQSSCDLVDFKDFKSAIEKSMLKGFSKKQILVFDWTL